MATMVPTEFDTIAAISTPPGEGAISIVRLSGEDAVKIANKVFKGKNLEKVPTHTINYGHIVNPKTNEELDEVMVSVMLAPRTFTREDVIEINCHGHGIVPDDRLFYTSDSWTGEVITDEINTEAFTISTSYNESAGSSSTTKYETRYYYIRER